jgi:hypothetical protein
MLSKIKTEVKNEILHISMRKWLLFYMSELKLYVTMEDIRALQISGAGKIESQALENIEDIELHMSGAGKIRLGLAAKKICTRLTGVGVIELSGTAEELEIIMSGAGTVNAHDLFAQKCAVRSSGVGLCSLYAVRELDVKLSGIGKVRYGGNPAVKSEISGLGKLVPIKGDAGAKGK